MFNDEYGPPTQADDDWFQLHVRSRDYPRVKRDPKPLEGQATIYDVMEATRLNHARDQLANCRCTLCYEDGAGAYRERR